MTTREKMLAVYKNQNQGKIPFAAYGGFLLPCGSLERTIRNKGCGWIHWTPVCSWQPPGMSHITGWDFEAKLEDAQMLLKTVWYENEKALQRWYETPVGNIYEELRTEPGYHSLWVKKFFVEKPEDYKVLKHIVQNSVVIESYESYLEAQRNIGNDGVELAIIDRSPFQKLLLEICGTERLTFDLIDIPEIVEELLETYEKKQLETLEIIADSPAEIIWMVENLTGDITHPEYFEKYCMPYYKKVTDILHKSNKVLGVHFDGKMNSIKHLIKKTDIDFIESFTLPEMGGDLPIKEAFELWEDKAIIVNIPAYLCNEGEEHIRSFIRQFIRDVQPYGNCMMELSENIPLEKLDRVMLIVADEFSKQ